MVAHPARLLGIEDGRPERRPEGGVLADVGGLERRERGGAGEEAGGRRVGLVGEAGERVDPLVRRP